jgi:hypothetical protein
MQVARCAEFFAEHGQHSKAAAMLAQARRWEEGLETVLAHGVQISEVGQLLLWRAECHCCRDAAGDQLQLWLQAPRLRPVDSLPGCRQPSG